MSELSKNRCVASWITTKIKHSWQAQTTHHVFRFLLRKLSTELKKDMLVDGLDHVLDLQHSHGSWFREGRSGKDYLDFFSCIASMPVGMNHPKMTDPAFLEYIGKAALNKPSNSDIYSTEMATFVKTFFELAVPSHFKYSFFIEGGALAVENAIKAAMDWKVRKNLAKGIKEEKGQRVLHFERAFHGRSGYTMSLTNTDPIKIKYFPKFDWPRVSTPGQRFPVTPESTEEVIKAEQQSIAEIKQAFADDPDGICCVIVEPILGEGGDIHLRKEFLSEVRDIAHENDALLIFDEVQTGVGITGRWWAHEAIGVQPDIMSFGKKMQVCGIVAGEKLDEVPDNVFHTSSRINSTWGGGLVDMVRVTKYLEIIDEENLVENAAKMGDYMHAKVLDMATKFDEGTVTNARGRGLFRAFDLPSTEIRSKLMHKVYDNGLLMVGSGQHSMRFRPPLNISQEEIDQGMEIIERSLRQVLA